MAGCDYIYILNISLILRICKVPWTQNGENISILLRLPPWHLKYLLGKARNKEYWIWMMCFQRKIRVSSGILVCRHTVEKDSRIPVYSIVFFFYFVRDDVLSRNILQIEIIPVYSGITCSLEIISDILYNTWNSTCNNSVVL